MTICLFADPSRCRDETLTVSEEDQTPHQCLMTAPVVVAQWAASHPRWSVQRWTCGRAKMEAGL